MLLLLNLQRVCLELQKTRECNGYIDNKYETVWQNLGDRYYLSNIKFMEKASKFLL